MADCCWWLWSYTSHLLSIQAPKEVQIRDWKLAIILRTLQLVTLVYVAYDIVQKRAYLYREVPIGDVTTYVDLDVEGYVELYRWPLRCGSCCSHASCFMLALHVWCIRW